MWWNAAIESLQECTETDHSTLRLHTICTTPPTDNRTTTSTNSSNNPFVCFSPTPNHALSDPAELIEGAPYRYYQSTSFLLEDDGWMVAPNSPLLFWVPPGSRRPFHNAWTAWSMPRGNEIDLSRMAHGQHWQNCRDE